MFASVAAQSCNELMLLSRPFGHTVSGVGMNATPDSTDDGDDADYIDYAHYGNDTAADSCT